jgi:hypothetical protein
MYYLKVSRSNYIDYIYSSESSNVVTIIVINLMGYLFANIGKGIYSWTNSLANWNSIDFGRVYLHYVQKTNFI